MKSKLIVFDLDDTLIDTSGKLNIETVWKDIEELELLDGVEEFLINFPIRKILVTMESTKGLQKAKLDKLEIFDLFEDVMICNSNIGKMNCFKEIEKNNNGVEIWAVGDRIDSEIKYANGLKWKSVLFKRGKHKDLKAQDGLEIPDYEINDFTEIKGLLR